MLGIQHLNIGNLDRNKENMNLKITHQNTCRICGANEPHKFLNLPNMPLPVGHIHPDSEEKPFIADLPIYWCSNCGVVQTLHDVDLSKYYENYLYSVSLSPLVQQFMQRFAQELWERFHLKTGDVVVEIGSSDGYQLKCFQKLGAQVLGFEPAEHLAITSREQGIETIQCLFGNDTLNQIPSNLRPIKLVITQYTFDHLPAPIEFLKTITKILDPDFGLVVIEIHDFEKIVERREACLFTHEHSIYLSVDSIASVFKQAGMKLICTDLVPENLRRGNSLIAVGALSQSQIVSEPQRQSLLLDSLKKLETYDKFAQSIWKSHYHLAEHVREMKKNGKHVAGYGAVGRGVNTLTIAGLNFADIEYVCDINSDLHGLLMPGSNILVVAPERLFDDPVSEVIVFNYGYMAEIKEKLTPYFQQGGKVTSMLEYLYD